MSVSFVSANIGVSPGKLNFGLNSGEEECQIVKILTTLEEGKIEVRDVWTTKEGEYNINHFVLNAGDVKTRITYPKELESFEGSRDVEVCLQSDYGGEWFGALIFRPEVKTNVVVESGVWMFVKSNGNIELAVDENTVQERTNERLVQAKSDETANEEDKSGGVGRGITGAVVSSPEGNGGYWIFGLIVGVIVVGVLCILAYKRWKSKRILSGY
jgi:hypothetical protein